MVFLGLDKLVCWEVSSNKAEMKEQDASNGEWCGVCSGRSCGLRCTSPCRAGTRPFLLVCSRIALDSPVGFDAAESFCGAHRDSIVSMQAIDGQSSRPAQHSRPTASFGPTASPLPTKGAEEDEATGTAAARAVRGVLAGPSVCVGRGAGIPTQAERPAGREQALSRPGESNHARVAPGPGAAAAGHVAESSSPRVPPDDAVFPRADALLAPPLPLSYCVPALPSASRGQRLSSVLYLLPHTLPVPVRLILSRSAGNSPCRMLS